MRYPSRPKPVEAVNGLDLEVRAGECFGLLGPNGAGKTTTVEILEGLLPPTSGEVKLLGRTWKSDGHSLRQWPGISLQAAFSKSFEEAPRASNPRTNKSRETEGSPAS